MLTVTSTTFHDKLQVDDEEVILNGPPGSLKGQILLHNSNQEPLRVRALPLQHLTKSALQANGSTQALRLSVRLQPQEKRMEPIVHTVSPQTPPGIYESTILAGGEKRKLKMIVQPLVAVTIQPRHFTFQGTAPGTVHTAVITLTNKGNLPFEIPDVKHLSLLDMDYLCRATAMAIRSKAAGESYAAMMDELTRNVQKNMADWISARIKEAGKIIAPGATQLIELVLTLPGNTDPLRDYSGDIRFWNKAITYTVKAYSPKTETKKSHGKQK